MSTINLIEIIIKREFFHEFRDDLRSWGVKHEPFWRVGDTYHVRIRDDPKIAFLKLKYENR